MSEVIIPPGADVRLSVLVPDFGVSLFCTRCNQIFVSDPAAISVEVNGLQYVLMTPFAPGCCGIVRQVVMVFRSNADAFAEMRRLVPQIQERGLGFLFPATFESVGIPKDASKWDGVHRSS